MTIIRCGFDGCERGVYARDLCVGHYSQLRAGRPLAVLRVVCAGSVGERLAAHSAPTRGGCIIWTASRNKDGYGEICVDGSKQYAHRVAYELAHGPIEPGMQVDHTCHTPACVRPDHLQQVTRKQNGENRAGATRRSKSGVRGVYRDRGKWVAQVKHEGRAVHVGRFDRIEDAEAAVVARRNELFSNSLADQGAVS